MFKTEQAVNKDKEYYSLLSKWIKSSNEIDLNQFTKYARYTDEVRIEEVTKEKRAINKELGTKLDSYLLRLSMEIIDANSEVKKVKYPNRFKADYIALEFSNAISFVNSMPSNYIPRHFICQ